MSLQVEGRESAGDAQSGVTQARGVRGGDKAEGWWPDLWSKDESAKPTVLCRPAVGTLSIIALEVIVIRTVKI